MLSHSQLFPLLSNGLGRVGALMAENSVAAVWVTNDPKVREYSRTMDSVGLCRLWSLEE